MANQPKTQHRSIRVPDDEWRRFGLLTYERGTNRAEAINVFIRWYLGGGELPQSDSDQPTT